MIRPIPLCGVTNDVCPVPLVEVHVDVGHLPTSQVEEALEYQAVCQRIDVGDSQAIGHDRAACRSAGGTHPDRAFTGIPNQIPNDEEVSRKPHRLDDTEFMFDPLHYLL